MRFPRSSGLLLHPTCLPGPFGVGDLGEGARRFVDFLVRARQSLWQILPLGPTGFGDSPYQCFSAFAGNPLLVDPEGLVADGLLEPGDVLAEPGLRDDRVVFDAAIRFKTRILARAAERFFATRPAPLLAEYEDFLAGNAAWLDDWALFAALRDAHGQRSWREWPAQIRRRDPAALAEARRSLGDGMDRERFRQFAFLRQWAELRRYAARSGVRIVGDLPIFVADDSCDAWAHPGQFLFDDEGAPTYVAGVPPDYFSATGQLWGNPLYRWEAMAADGFRWWIDRLRGMLAQVDLVRIDHFIGFTRAWHVPAGAATAIDGTWRPGPGSALFEALRGAIGDPLPIVAEDLGATTPEVEALRDRYGLCGMKVLQFAFSRDPANPFLPHAHAPGFVVYTGTHDNDTTRGWFESLAEDDRSFVRRYLARSGDDIAWDMIRAAEASVADIAVIPVQDVLGLGSEARMNAPGRPQGNWTWRLPPGALREEHADRLAEMAWLYDRDPAARAPRAAGSDSGATAA
ncbi:MAG: 4-alpha-glucanotransferase [Deltaproteobacteria bacterium]